MTLKQFNHVIAELKSMDYPLNEDTIIGLDIDLISRREIIDLRFEDKGYKFAVRRMIDDNEN